MGQILDLAVVALGLVVIGSLATLAWTLAVSAVRAERQGLASVAEARRRTAVAEERVRAAAARADAVLGELEFRVEQSASYRPSSHGEHQEE